MLLKCVCFRIRYFNSNSTNQTEMAPLIQLNWSKSSMIIVTAMFNSFKFISLQCLRLATSVTIDTYLRSIYIFAVQSVYSYNCQITRNYVFVRYRIEKMNTRHFITAVFVSISIVSNVNKIVEKV